MYIYNSGHERMINWLLANQIQTEPFFSLKTWRDKMRPVSASKQEAVFDDNALPRSDFYKQDKCKLLLRNQVRQQSEGLGNWSNQTVPFAYLQLGIWLVKGICPTRRVAVVGHRSVEHKSSSNSNTYSYFWFGDCSSYNKCAFPARYLILDQIVTKRREEKSVLI